MGLVSLAAGAWALAWLVVDFRRHFARSAAPEVVAGVVVGLFLPLVTRTMTVTPATPVPTILSWNDRT